MRRAVALVLVGALALAGCGLSEDDQPEAIPEENIPPGLLDPNPTTTTVTPIGGGSDVTVYLVERTDDGPRLSAVEREVADPERAGDLVTALLSQPTEAEVAAGLTTSIPSDTVLLHTEFDDADENVLRIDVSSSLFDVQGEELATAFAQFVWTVTQLRGVREVLFLVDGEPINAQDAEGVEQEGPVSTSDYVDLAPDD